MLYSDWVSHSHDKSVNDFGLSNLQNVTMAGQGDQTSEGSMVGNGLLNYYLIIWEEIVVDL